MKSPDLYLEHWGIPELFSELITDTNHAFEGLYKNKSSQYLRRCAVRSVFGFIEGVCSVLLNSTYFKYQENNNLFTSKEKLALEGKETDLTQRIKKLFSAYAKCHGFEFQLNTNSVEYEYFIRAKKCINKLTHPTKYNHIVVTDEAMADVAQSYEWLRSEFLRLMNALISHSLNEIPKEYHGAFKKLLKST